MRMRALLVVGALVLGLTGCSGADRSEACQLVQDPAFDTTDVGLLTQRSQSIVVASVSASSGTIDNPADPRTLFPVTVIKALKGNPPSSFTVAQEGTDKCKVLGTGSKPIKAGDYLLFVDEKGVGVDWYHLWNSIHLTSADLASIKSGSYAPDQAKLQKTMAIIANDTKPQASK
ncbi:Uncharacterised protein [Mycobacteroides abscessus subsp. massiliense]|nr:Uncharacterised protein [Mycobacteroides abscessus subsp. massiliense]SKU34578.1 Uncharacterised protein [Mycobacteroides abscessus subsp. massiliense]SLE37800.1 Uncharacterised protein [Mycobacteroides abscessus subsp. massiliense]